MNNLDEGLSLKDKIFSAALEEFAEKGYKGASTNSIMNKAGVSKGLIFHYFKNKENLYTECVHKAFEDYVDACSGLVDLDEHDFIERTKKFTEVKLNWVNKNPQSSSLIVDAYTVMREGDMPELAGYIDATRHKFLELFYKDLDIQRFRKFASSEKLFDNILIIIESFTNSFIDRYKTYGTMMENIDECVKELDVLYEIIRHGVYES